MYETLSSIENDHQVVNFAEKIVLVIDTVNDSPESQYRYESNSGRINNFLYMIKRAVEIFLNNKFMLNKQHEFAIIALDSDQAHWLLNFSNNLDVILNVLEGLEETIIESDQSFFDLRQIFDLIHQNVISNILPLQNQIVRTVFLYSRSNIIPRFNVTEHNFQETLKYPNFFLDILYIHEPPSSKNQCEIIYNELTKLETRKVSYIMEVAKNVITLNKCMAIFLGHPIQRTMNKNRNFSIHPSIIKMAKEQMDSR